MKHNSCFFNIIAAISLLALILAGNVSTCGLAAAQTTFDSSDQVLPDESGNFTPPSAVNGNWCGRDALGDIQVTISTGTIMIISHPGSDLLNEVGRITAADDKSITLLYENGASQTYFYLVTDETMILADETFQTPMVLNRKNEDESISSDIHAMIGTWGKVDEWQYSEVTLTEDGTGYITVPADEEYCRDFAYTAVNGTLYVYRRDMTQCAEYQLSGDKFILIYDGQEITMTRKSGSLQRTSVDPGAASVPLDAAVLGTWGGSRGDYYTEWTFNGDGSYRCYIPQDETMNYEGEYTAQNGIMSLIVNGEKQDVMYEVADNTVIGLRFSDTDSFGYARKSGPLIRNHSGKD